MAIAKHDEKVEICYVEGCNLDAERSFNYKQVSESDLKLKPGEHNQIHLCKAHYRDFKRQTKKIRVLDRIY